MADEPGRKSDQAFRTIGELARRIHRLLNEQGYTIRGVQQLLASKEAEAPVPRRAITAEDLRAIRRTLAEALEQAEL